MSEILNNELGSEKLERSIKTLAILYGLADEDLKYFAGLSLLERHSFTPSRHYDFKILNYGVQEKIILINNKTHGEGKSIFEFLQGQQSAMFDIPLNFNNLREYMESQIAEIIKHAEHKSHEIFVDFITELSANECIGFLESSQEKYNLHFKIGEKTEIIFKNALKVYSVSEIISLLWSAFKSALAKTQTGNISRSQAALSVIPNFERLLLRASEDKWKITKYSRLNSIPQSILSNIVFNYVLGSYDDGYHFSIPWLYVSLKLGDV